MYVFPLTRRENNDAVVEPPAEQGNERYSRNPGNASGAVSSNEDRALQVQLCSVVVLIQPEINRVDRRHYLKGSITTVSSHIRDLSFTNIKKKIK